MTRVRPATIPVASSLARSAFALPLLLALLGLAVPPAAAAQEGQEPPVPESQAGEDRVAPATMSPEGRPPPPGFALQPGDAIQVRIWREPDLSGDFHVNEEGDVVIPLLGTRNVTGVPWSQLRDELIEAYQHDLNNPAITITPRRRVYILGHVRAPGLYGVDPTISLAGAVAMAGGASPDGDLEKVRVVRDGTTILDDVAVDSPLAAIDVRSGDQIFIERRGWVERNTNFLITAALSVTSIVVSILR